VPFLIALACAANVGSAATLIGNPQNMLIGQTLELSFARYLLVDALVPTALGLAVTWGVICLLARGRWQRESATAPPRAGAEAPAFDAWQTAKGLTATAVVVGLFLFTGWPRELVVLGASGVLLLSRKLHSRDTLWLVDWQLLVLFMGLFVINHALAQTGTLDEITAALARGGVDLERPAVLFGATAILSNLVSNVPAVLLLLPSATDPRAGAVLALASTLAGNLLIVGSIANIIVVTQAEALGVRISWRTHARFGVPVTLATLAIAGAWIAWR
jgi:Na+/H+ antiporter NhaD/arsenite permease-like protein